MNLQNFNYLWLMFIHCLVFVVFIYFFVYRTIRIFGQLEIINYVDADSDKVCSLCRICICIELVNSCIWSTFDDHKFFRVLYFGFQIAFNWCTEFWDHYLFLVIIFSFGWFIWCSRKFRSIIFSGDHLIASKLLCCQNCSTYLNYSWSICSFI